MAVRRVSRLVALVVVGCVGAVSSGCAGGGDPGAEGRIAVVAGENFWGNIAAQLGGDRVRVISIITDPNADPHEYQSDLADAAAIQRANVVIENGAGYDGFLATLLSAHAKANRTVLNVGRIVGVSGANPNPHLWYDPAYVVTAAEAIEAQFAKQDRAAAPVFKANLATFRRGEQQVVGVIDQIRARYAGEAIAYTERVPGYLIRAAGLRLGTPAAFSQAIEDGSDPSPADNATFESAITDHQVKVLLYNAQVSDAETTHLKQLARSSGVPVVGVTETMPPKAKNFQTWQADQARELLEALGG